ncbi:MAG: hypothetical protein QM817_32135 [Archangium sp.]
MRLSWLSLLLLGCSPGPVLTDAGGGLDAGEVITDAGTRTFWPTNAVAFTLRTGGPFEPSCAASDGGRVTTTYTVELDAGQMTYDVCFTEDGGFGSPSIHREGSRALTPTERVDLDGWLGKITEATTTLSCGSDSPVLTLQVTNSYTFVSSYIEVRSFDPPSCMPPMGTRISGGWLVAEFLERRVR